MARRLSASAVLLVALLGSVVLAAPAQAAERVISITADGLLPRTLTIAAGDTVVLVNDDAAFRYRATSTTGRWSFDSGLIPLARGQRYVLPEISDSGAYGFTVFQNEAPFTGTITLPAPGTAVPRPATSPSTGSSSGGSTKASPTSQPSSQPSGAASASPAPAGGTGAAALPPLSAGFGAVDPAPSPAPGAPAPAIAPDLLALPGEVPAPQAAGKAVASPTPLTNSAIQGDLPGTGTSRGYGLPAVLAAVLAAGVASLLVRLLLAEPAARRAVAGLRGPNPAAAVD